jgi:hypothetical protein
MANIYALTHRHAHTHARAHATLTHQHAPTPVRPSGTHAPIATRAAWSIPASALPNRSRLHGAEAQSCPRATSSYCLLPNLSTHTRGCPSRMQSGLRLVLLLRRTLYFAMFNIAVMIAECDVAALHPPTWAPLCMHPGLWTHVIYRFGEVARCELSETVRMPSSHLPTSLRNAACTRRGWWLRSHTATRPRYMYRTLCAGTWLLFYFKGILRAKKII